ncbi:MAG: FAD binding domain-containing protein [Ilumatobacteraceae bacterium]
MSCLTPTVLSDALDALTIEPDALILAGGTDVMVEINMGHRRPTSVVAVNRIPELRSWSHDPATSTVRIGAAVTYAEVLDDPLADLLPALAQAARTVGSPQIRHTATVGGNVGTASPAGDGLPVLAALDAVIHLASNSGNRDVPFTEFVVAPKRTVRRSDELITAITVPVLRGWQGYSKVGVRNAMVIATATCCLAVDEANQSVRLALGSVGPVIIRATDAELFAASAVDFDARLVSDATVKEFAVMAAAASRPIDDHRSTAAYRRHAIGVLAGRLLRRAFPNV